MLTELEKRVIEICEISMDMAEKSQWIQMLRK